jgi:hypothetical protein
VRAHLLHEQENAVLSHFDAVLDLVQRKRSKVLSAAVLCVSERARRPAERAAWRACTVSLDSMMQNVSGSATESKASPSAAGGQLSRRGRERERTPR